MSILYSATRAAVGAPPASVRTAVGIFAQPVYKGPVYGPSEAFVIGDWTLTDPVTDGDLTITVTQLPTSGEAIADIEYRVDAGAWTSGATATGPITISGLTNTTSYAVEIRAVNRHGASVTSDTKNAIPTV